MPRVINEQDVDLVERVLRDELGKKIQPDQPASGEQPLQIDLLGTLVLQVMIPLLVSITSTVVTDIIKEKYIDKGGKDEIAIYFVGRPVREDEAIKQQAMNELQDQLGPLGFQEHEVRALYDQIRARLA